MPLLNNSRRQITISDTVHVTFLRANRGRKYGCLIFSLAPPSLRCNHTVRTLCELSAIMSSAAMPVLCALYCQNTIISNNRTKVYLTTVRFVCVYVTCRHPCQHQYHHLLLVSLGTRSRKLDVSFKLPRDWSCRPIMAYL